MLRRQSFRSRCRGIGSFTSQYFYGACLFPVDPEHPAGRWVHEMHLLARRAGHRFVGLVLAARRIIGGPALYAALCIRASI